MPLDVEARADGIERELVGRPPRRRTWEEAFVERLLAGAEDESGRALRARLFRFVDVLPSLADSREVCRHFVEHVPAEAPWPLRFGRTAASAWLCHGAAAAVIRRAVRRVAERFVAGATPAEAFTAARALEAEGCGATFDLLGEAVVAEAEADAHRDRCLDLLSVLDRPWPGEAPAPLVPCGPRKNLSVKLSALDPRCEPLDGAGASRRVRARLRPIVARARAAGVFVHVDAEEHDLRDLTLRTVGDLLEEAEFRDLDSVGVVLQAYLRDAEAVLDEILAWARRRGRDLTVRLVRGAYWDVEVARAIAAGRTPPVWRTKAETDACYDRLLGRLLEAHRDVRTAVATHNVRSIARALALVEDLRVPPGRWEVQMLHGMGLDLRAALVERGVPVRVYAPVGDLLEGIGYLVRRLLENASNESLLGRALERRPSAALAAAAPADWPRPPLRHAPHADFALAEERDSFAASIEAVGRRLGIDVPTVIDGRRFGGRTRLERRDPSRPSVVVATLAASTPVDASCAVAVARRALPAWEGAGWEARAAALDRAADALLGRRREAAAWEVHETAKPWREADADVCEAVDHLRWAALEARARAAGVVLEPEVPGERNLLLARPRGVVAAITPWNFPLAIPAGVLGPALAAGCAVVWKPAEESSACALLLAEALWEAGVPPGALALLPGRGEEVGAALAAHADVDVVAFTGSRAVGLSILRAAPVGRRGPRKVVAEMGGKNAIVVDLSADLDEAARAVVASAFGYAGQKCSAASRLVVVEGAGRVVERVVGAAATLRLGPASDPATDVPPLISAEARERVARYAAIARREGRVLHDVPAAALPAEGHHVGPLVVEHLPDDSPVWREEIFGPVLAVRRARNLDEGVALANDADTALTAAFLSRTPSRIDRAVRAIRAGNLYVNRRSTGAIVGRHPFGGHAFSGTGEKTGGPAALDPYLVPVAVGENVVRHGYVGG